MEPADAGKERDQRGRFQPGTSGNPAGRPVLPPALVPIMAKLRLVAAQLLEQALRESLAKLSDSELMALARWAGVRPDPAPPAGERRPEDLTDAELLALGADEAPETEQARQRRERREAREREADEFEARITAQQRPPRPDG